ncbi:MAG: SGNH/GDSL hydrolase family protein [Cyclobacteriaceae bacterium]
MRKISVSALQGSLLLFITFIHTIALAKTDTTAIGEQSQSLFELKDGDRVVFLGNSLFEFDQQYGYIEFALTSRWPDRAITFRNLGWTGDTVFGDARSYFTSPPSAYELLIQQITKAQPTVVFLAYGANEAYEGETGLSHFVDGLNQLLDEIDKLGAKTVLLSPIPQMPAEPTVNNLEERNQNLQLYASAISRTAAERDMHFIDLFKPLQKLSGSIALTTDGVHLNETGYYHLATMIEDGLGLPPRTWSVKVNLSQQLAESASSAAILDSDIGKENIEFTVDDTLLPLPRPKQEEVDDDARKLSISGLGRGCYTLRVDESQVASAMAKTWAKGVEISQGASFTQADQLRDRILKKNELFFHQYRPLNRTYIIGFRSYEQGRHIKELEDLDLLIGWLEDQIAEIRAPKPVSYQLTPVM